MKVKSLDNEMREIKNLHPVIEFIQEKHNKDVVLDVYYTIMTNCRDLCPKNILKNIKDYEVLSNYADNST